MPLCHVEGWQPRCDIFSSRYGQHGVYIGYRQDWPYKTWPPSIYMAHGQTGQTCRPGLIIIYIEWPAMLLGHIANVLAGSAYNILPTIPLFLKSWPLAFYVTSGHTGRALSIVIAFLHVRSQGSTLEMTEGSGVTSSDPMQFLTSHLFPMLSIMLQADSRPQILQECLKCKSDLEIPDDSLPPSLKWRTRARPYAISELAAGSRPQIFQERLKHKSDLETPDDSLPPSLKQRTCAQSYAISDFTLPVADLRTVTQVCRLSRDIAASLYFHSMGFHIEQTWLRVNAQGCLALLLYTWTAFFRIPQVLRCDFLDISDHNLTALKVFLEALRGTLSSIQWATLLRNVHLPLLHMFSIDIECPPAALGDFLAWHLTIGQVWITPGHTPTLVTNDSSQHVIPDYRLQNLGVLEGPPWYLLALLAKVHPAHSIRHLSMRFEEDSTLFNPNYLSVILDITQHFTTIQELQLSFYGTAHSAEHFEVLDNECHTVPAKNLAISTHCEDDIFVSFPSYQASLVLITM
ncbi:uncharacterized protein EDB93DRAFT_1106656 [Suillus bovinus]|uniref:uncharacterized protein n=1 Tax=Suillus bovinus TaxID=48563 RepID=UPI001B85B6AC|nr:uncharacterized protein EDB93DRAFT_1106656 [Suillus bovinus]KAG2137105.1 hypothetical protein EDB93DRAFT_1106656 [Suillus bovinus]